MEGSGRRLPPLQADAFSTEGGEHSAKNAFWPLAETKQARMVMRRAKASGQ